MSYYKPDIEDIRYDYQFERLINGVWKVHSFQDPETIESFDTKYNYIPFSTDISKGLVRVPFLTREQIEGEGYKFESTNGIQSWYFLQEVPPSISDYYRYPCYKVKLVHDPDYNTIKIFFDFAEDNLNPMFEGECKSINELRFVQKLLHIK